MPNINKVIVQGHLGRDPEVRYSPDGNAICNFSLATSTSWKDKQTGERREETEWHRCVIYNRRAEVIGEYARKGTKLYIEGRLRTRKWAGQDGIDRYTTEIIVDSFKFGPKGVGDQEPQYQNPKPVQQASQQTPYQAPADNLADMDDDIPF